MSARDPYRTVALQAAGEHIMGVDSNVLVRGRMWIAVTAALDEYERQIVAAENRVLRPVWVLHHVDGRPWITFPSKRVAQQYRRILARETGTPRHRLRIVAARSMNL